MNEKRLENINAAIEAKKKEQGELRDKLTENVQRATRMKGEYEDTVKSGADEAKLDEMDAALFKGDRERTRIEIRLTQCGVEIEDLLRARTAALAEIEREKFNADAMAALAEAAELEQIVQSLVAKAATHWQRVQRLKRYADAAGCVQNPFKRENLERRVSAIFRGGSVHSAYEQTYDQILQSNIDFVEKQLGRQTEQPAETVPTQAIAS